MDSRSKTGEGMGTSVPPNNPNPMIVDAGKEWGECTHERVRIVS